MGVLFGRVTLKGLTLHTSQGFCGISRLFARPYAILRVSARFGAFVRVSTRGGPFLEGYFEETGGGPFWKGHSERPGPASF